MLVPEHLYRKVADAVDAKRLRARLAYERMAAAPRSARPVTADALARRIRPKPGSEHAAWLDAEIMRRFDHDCVEDARDLVGLDRGVTRAGQVKSSRTSHLKDDRRDLTDSRNWTVGVDPAERLEQVIAEGREVTARLEDIGGELAAHSGDLVGGARRRWRQGSRGRSGCAAGARCACAAGAGRARIARRGRGPGRGQGPGCGSPARGGGAGPALAAGGCRGRTDRDRPSAPGEG